MEEKMKPENDYQSWQGVESLRDIHADIKQSVESNVRALSLNEICLGEQSCCLKLVLHANEEN